jgi:putative ABC transport system ATP-binding protein
MITLSGVYKSFSQGETQIQVLKDISLSITSGEVVAIMGPSGSGKSTLLSLMSGMDTPTKGTIEVDGKNLSLMTDRELSLFRNQTIGIVFQTFELIPSFTTLENVLLPGDVSGKTKIPRARELLEGVGLSHRVNQLPGKLSGGEAQRVAIARALMNGPRVLFADEPTGNLDQHNGKNIIDLLVTETKKNGGTLVLITHDRMIAEKADRILSIRDGVIEAKH